MTIEDAEKEFLFRYSVWAKAEWEKEVNASFPHLRLFKTGHAWNVYQFMQKLNKEDQLAWARGEESALRKFDAFYRVRDQFQIFKQLRSEGTLPDPKIMFDHCCAPHARILCDTDSTDAEFLSSELDAFLGSIPQSFEEQVKAKKNAGEKIRFVSKKRLQKYLTQKVKDVFGSKYEEYRVDEGHWTAFDIKCDGWMLQTQFNFGRKPGYQQSVLGYWHNICSQKKAPHPAMPEVMYPVAYLCRGVRWPCSSEWEYLTEEDVELACNETFKYCRYFYEAAPRLLKGLESEKITVG
jgi:hypothetical protein